VEDFAHIELVEVDEARDLGGAGWIVVFAALFKGQRTQQFPNCKHKSAQRTSLPHDTQQRVNQQHRQAKASNRTPAERGEQQEKARAKTNFATQHARPKLKFG